MAQTPAQTPATQQPATTTSTSYAYTPYHPPIAGTYSQMSAAYPSPYSSTASYQTGVTGYGAWPYQYSYVPQQHAQSSAQQVRPNTALPPTTSTYTSSYVPAAAPKTTTFSSYTPTTQVRESAPAATAPPVTTGRTRSKQQANFKGLFTKERAFHYPVRTCAHCLSHVQLKTCCTVLVTTETRQPIRSTSWKKFLSNTLRMWWAISALWQCLY